jgi:palmitoyltransferase ZDHHC3/7/25
MEARRGARTRAFVRRCIGKLNLPVILVLVVYAYVYKMTMRYGFGERSPASSGQPGAFAEGIFVITAGLGWVMYACTVLRDPGKVPSDYAPCVESGGGGGSGEMFVETKRKGGGHRFCQKCERHKPPRTHHCRVCKRCVLRMDHHCVWVNNCVGHYNYKSFFLFLAYTTMALAQAVYHLGTFSRDEIFSPHGSAVDDFMTTSLVTMSLCLALALTVAIALLFLWHVRLVVNNKTTIEHYEGVRSKYNNIPHVIEHPYSLGVHANVREILGRNAVLWCTPGCKISGDGTRFTSILEISRGGSSVAAPTRSAVI